jgi:hypothetical protein
VSLGVQIQHLDVGVFVAHFYRIPFAEPMTGYFDAQSTWFHTF